VLRDLGFEAAVKALADRLALHDSLQVELDIGVGETLAERAQVGLYQLIREALAQAVGRNPTRLSIVIADAEDGSVTLTVTDDGHLERRRGTAEAFEERARPLSGQVQFSPSETGTAVTVALPAYTVRK
jgi:signal transduction histidine kinase